MTSGNTLILSKCFPLYSIYILLFQTFMSFYKFSIIGTEAMTVTAIIVLLPNKSYLFVAKSLSYLDVSVSEYSIYIHDLIYILTVQMMPQRYY